MNSFPHYFKPLPPGCTHVDVYRVLRLFEVSDPALQHAVKKLLCAGARGAKDQAQDIAEAVATLQRWQQMREEEQPEPDLRDAIEDMRATAAKYCECRARLAEECPGQREPGCDMGANEARAVPARPEDAERAAYLARWANAPEWARWLAQDPDGTCAFFESHPCLDLRGIWMATKDYDHHPIDRYAARNLLGSTRCEPRPVPDEGQGVGP